MRLRKLDIDFAGHRRAAPWAGRVLLAAALAFSADVGLSYTRLSGQVLEAQARLDSRPRAYAGRPASPEELAAARESVQRLSTPWASLLAALESAATDRVALLGIEPDPQSGTVTITGDSKDYLAALTYVLNLSRAEALAQVHLARHEVKQNDPHKSVSFSVSAAWGTPRK